MYLYNDLKAKSGHAVLERPTPVCFACAPHQSPSEWSDYLIAFNDAGYMTNRVIAFPSFNTDPIDSTAVTYLRQEIDLLQSIPPLMVTYGQESTLLTLKYLESYPLAGLILINASTAESKEGVHSALLEEMREMRLPLLKISEEEPFSTEAIHQAVDFMNEAI